MLTSMQATNPAEFLLFAISGQLDPEIKQACIIKANLSGLAEGLNPIDGPVGPYFDVRFGVVIKADSTNSKVEAFLRWEEKVRV